MIILPVYAFSHSPDVLFSLIELVIILVAFWFLVNVQREARGSVTFKIVPSYRSNPPPCEVSYRHTYFIFCASNLILQAQCNARHSLPLSAFIGRRSNGTIEIKLEAHALDILHARL